MPTPVYVANGSNAASPDAAAGGAYFFTQALRRCGVSVQPLALPRLSSRPLRVLGGVARSGFNHGFRLKDYYFSHAGQDAKWDDLPDGSVLIDFFQVTPTRWLERRRDVMVIKYIDLTLRQLFDYDAFRSFPNKRQVYLEEQASYEAADHIACYTPHAAQSLVDDYGLDRRKVSVIRSGANLAPDIIRDRRRTALEPADHLAIIFIGVDWRRKGLAFLDAVAGQLTARGLSTSITAIGPSADAVSHLKSVRALGYVSKRGDEAAYAELIAAHQLGALWSHREGLPNSVLECLALGVPMLAPDIPQLAGVLPEAASIVPPLGASPAEAADAVLRKVTDPAWLRRAGQRLRDAPDEFTWRRGAEQFAALLREKALALG